MLNPFEVLDAHYQKYGPVSKASLTFQKFAVALGPEFIQQLMLDTKQSFSARMGYNTPLGDFFAGGLLMRDFDEHKFHRRIMQTAFKIDAMRSYVELMHPIIDRELSSWGQTANSSSTPTSRPCYWMSAPRCSWAWIWRGLKHRHSTSPSST